MTESLQNNLLLEVKNLNTFFYTGKGVAKAVENVSFKVFKGEILGIVGESGSGKSVTCLSIMRLIPNPPGKILSGQVLFKGNDLLKLPYEAMYGIRGKSISFIFQEPMTALNPVLPVKVQMCEILENHFKMNKKDALIQCVEMLKKLGIKEPEKRIHDYPFNFSGGMLQRVMIGMALLANPELIIADEPTTALDASCAEEILNLLKDVKKTNKDLSIIFVTHNLRIVNKICNRVIIMYGGKIQETAATENFFKSPLHPYTKGLMKCYKLPESRKTKLEYIKGQVPDMTNLPKGCKFHDRCEIADMICRNEEPELKEIASGHFVRCFKCT